jgi:hypothetical protein
MICISTWSQALKCFLGLNHLPVINYEKSKQAVEYYYGDVVYGAFLNEIMAIREAKMNFRFSSQSSSEGISK